MLHDVESQPHLAVVYYLSSVYLYAEHSDPVLSDLCFEWVCRYLYDNFDTIDHRHKHLVDKRALLTATTVGYDFTVWPARIKSAALMWARQKDIITMLQLSDDMKLEYTRDNWVLTVTKPTEKGESERKYYFGSPLQALKKAAERNMSMCDSVQDMIDALHCFQDVVLQALAAVDVKTICAEPTTTTLHTMTDPDGPSYEQYREAGWTDEQLLAHGKMTK